MKEKEWKESRENTPRPEINFWFGLGLRSLRRPGPIDPIGVHDNINRPMPASPLRPAHFAEYDE